MMTKRKKRLGKQFAKLETRLRRITSASEMKAGKFLKANTKELARKVNSLLTKYQAQR